MSGAIITVLGAAVNVIDVTVGNESTSTKFGTIDEWGFSNAANSIDGVAYGAVSPTTLFGANILKMATQDDTLSAGSFYLILSGDKSATTITSLSVNGHVYLFTNPGTFSGGQTTWTANAFGPGNQWGVGAGSHANAVIS